MKETAARPKRRAAKVSSDSSESDGDGSEEESDESQDESERGRIRHIFAGYQDGSIRKWDLRNGNCTLHIEKETKK